MTTPAPAAPALPLDEAALAMARKWNLVTDEGQVLCLRGGCDQLATLPSLLCRAHLVAHRRGYR